MRLDNLLIKINPVNIFSIFPNLFTRLVNIFRKKMKKVNGERKFHNRKNYMRSAFARMYRIVQL